jgi:hypothetical protein
MNRFICNTLFTSPQTGTTYHPGDEIDQYEFDRLSYSDSKRFIINPKHQSFAFQASSGVLAIQEIP